MEKFSEERCCSGAEAPIRPPVILVPIEYARLIALNDNNVYKKLIPQVVFHRDCGLQNMKIIISGGESTSCKCNEKALITFWDAFPDTEYMEEFYQNTLYGSCLRCNFHGGDDQWPVVNKHYA